MRGAATRFRLLALRRRQVERHVRTSRRFLPQRALLGDRDRLYTLCARIRLLQGMIHPLEHCTFLFPSRFLIIYIMYYVVVYTIVCVTVNQYGFVGLVLFSLSDAINSPTGEG